jgi:Ala-tRNA(Pro) deacylase
MIANRLKKHLDEHQVRYVGIEHSPAYTAQEVAQSAHIRGAEFAKTVVVFGKGGQARMAMLPATHRIEFAWLSRVLGHDDVRLATEDEFKGLFPDCEPGAMPPFGTLYGMPVLCDTSLAAHEEIVFNAGTHRDAVRMSFRDYLALARPEVESFAAPMHTGQLVAGA